MNKFFDLPIQDIPYTLIISDRDTGELTIRKIETPEEASIIVNNYDGCNYEWVLIFGCVLGAGECYSDSDNFA